MFMKKPFEDDTEPGDLDERDDLPEEIEPSFDDEDDEYL